MHDTDAGESIDNVTAVSESKIAAVDEPASDIVKSIAEEIVEHATSVAEPAAPLPGVDIATAETSISNVPSLMQVLTPENVVLPAQPETASEATIASDQ